MEGLVGRKAVIFYDDLGKCSRKDGILTEVQSSCYVLDDTIIIPISRVIRIEITKTSDSFGGH